MFSQVSVILSTGMGRGCAWQGGVLGRRDGHCSGRYTSYWNAFLFIIFIHYEVLSLPRKVITSHNFDFSAKAWFF